MHKILFGVLMITALSISACSNKSSSIQVPQASYYPTQGWHTSTPEAQGFDSAKVAEGLQAMREQGINIHSLTVIRNDDMVLDAYFYPYDGTTFHEIASVTKSVMTTLIGIAADQGKLSLDDKMISFFPRPHDCKPRLLEKSNHCSAVGGHDVRIGLHLGKWRTDPG
jgi:CubicO group peptidase (beta-lactamase class C family)